jgi:integrase/recombinase XerD
MFTLLAETGMRIGELTHLTWDDVDLVGGFIHVRPKDDWKPKSGDRRAIPISPLARKVLELLPHASKWVVCVSKPGCRQPDQISDRRLLRDLKLILAKLGLKGHLHTFRHSFISHALTEGVPEAIVRQWVGHVDSEVLKLYTHIADHASKDAMKRLAEGKQPITEEPKGDKNHDKQ